MNPGGNGNFIAIRPSSCCDALLPSSRRTCTVDDECISDFDKDERRVYYEARLFRQGDIIERSVAIKRNGKFS